MRMFLAQRDREPPGPATDIDELARLGKTRRRGQVAPSHQRHAVKPAQEPAELFLRHAGEIDLRLRHVGADRLCGEQLGAPLGAPQGVNAAHIAGAALDQVMIGHRRVGEPGAVEFEKPGHHELVQHHLQPARPDPQRIGKLARGHRAVAERREDAELQGRTHRHRRKNSAAYAIDRLARRRRVAVRRHEFPPAEAGKISDLITTGTAPDDGISAPMSI